MRFLCRLPDASGRYSTAIDGTASEPAEDHRLLYIKTKDTVVEARGSLLEAVQGSWKIGDRVEQAEYVIAVVDKMCVGVFVAEKWHRRPDGGRRYFVGREAPA